jgi:hypothetical protein
MGSPCMGIIRDLRNYVLVTLNIKFLSNFLFNAFMRKLIPEIGVWYIGALTNKILKAARQLISNMAGNTKKLDTRINASIKHVNKNSYNSKQRLYTITSLMCCLVKGNS